MPAKRPPSGAEDLEVALEEQLQFERTITNLVKEFVSVDPGALRPTIQRNLETLIGYFGVERSTLLRVRDDGSLEPLGSARARAAPAAPPRITVPWYLEALRAGRRIQITDALAELPAGADEERAYVRESGMRSHLAIPLMSSGQLWGLIGFASFSQPRSWTEQQAQRLGLVGEIMMSAVLRQESEERSRRQRDELAHVTRVAALGELTAALAHELNEPLAAIRTNAQATRRFMARDGVPRNLDEVLSDIVRDATRAGELIRRLRNLLRRGETVQRPLDVNEVIRNVEPIAVAEARRHGAHLTLELAQEVPRISGDAIQLQQVLLNLVRNAAEAMRDNPLDDRAVIVRTAVERSAEITVVVLDAGPPVDDATLHAMFVPFQTTKPDGLGMGLAISRSIVEMHGGRIWAVARPTAGLAMHFTVPVSSTEP